MDDVALAVDEDVAVVSVFDLEDVGEEGIGSERIDEVFLFLRHLISKHLFVEFIKANKVGRILL